MAAKPFIVGNVVSSIGSDYTIFDSAMVKTLTIVGIILLFFIFIYLIPLIIHKKHRKKKISIPRYRPFKNL